MKKMLMFMLAVVMTTMVYAGDVTPDEALEQAMSFMQKREASGRRVRKAPGKEIRMSMPRKVCGLYVFNVNNNDGGYVIVSSDDRTIPILGFSDSGHIDPDNMPENMKAWLQGYADEIAWLEKHNITSTTGTQANAPKHIGSHSTDPISPLLTTTWDQDKPYNNLCPKYDGSNRSATGCVATAMAQVMNYHKWPESATTDIPGYTSGTIDLKDGLPATTFDWTNMKDSYKEEYTSEEATAVATLMQYCGYSLKMRYGSSSAAFTGDVATALKTYYDYSNTATYIERNQYNAAKWADIIYHELANNRPVAYCGESSKSGHAFVCDGYQYNEGDLFHINWGWGSISDGYFVLSALNPNEQGIGGSSSADGYNHYQQAVIGIQPSTGTGTIADITPNIIDLTANSITPESNPAYVGVPVNIIVNITNNSTDDFGGEIGINCYCQGIADPHIYSHILIAAGETKDVVIPFTPTAAGTYNLWCGLPNANGGISFSPMGKTLTVEDPTNNEFVPIYSNYDNELSCSQFIIPASDLQDKQYANLNGVTFYFIDTSSTMFSPFTWGAAEFEVYLGEVSKSTFADATLKDWNSLEKVYAGRLSAYNRKMKITFDTPFQYMGGNLLVGIKQTVVGDYHNNKWIGINAPGSSLGGTSNATTPVSQRNFLPLTTFNYTPGTAPTIAKPIALSVNYTGGTTAEVKWTSTESAWDIDVNGIVTENVTNPYTLTNLEPATVYTMKVRAKNDSGVSEWSAPTTFNTDLADDWCQLRFELTDNWGDGWNGAAIRVVDKLTGVVIATVSNTNKAVRDQAQTYTMDVPNGRDIDFVWVSGDYDDGCSYAVYDVNGNVIFSGSGAMSDTVTYHVSCRILPYPSELTITPAPTSATLTWTDVADNYDVRYGLLPHNKWLQYDDDKYRGNWGYDQTHTLTWGVMYPNSEVEGKVLTKVSWYEVKKFYEDDITLKIYSGINTPATLLYTQKVTPEMSNGFHEVTLPTPVETLSGEDLWIMLTAKGTKVISYCRSNESNNQWILRDGRYCHLSDLNPSYAGNGFMIRGYTETAIEDHTISWTTTTCSEPTCQVTGLKPDTDYVVQVRGDYGEEGNSQWTTATFTTLKLIELADDADNSSVIEEHDGETVNIILNGRTLWKDGTWNTLCLPFDLTIAGSILDGATARPLIEASISGSTLNLTFGDAIEKLIAGTPYLIKWDAAETNIMNPIFCDVTVSVGTNNYDNAADGELRVRFLGTYDFKEFTAADQSILFMGGENKLYYPQPSGGQNPCIGACRAYFKIGDGETLARELTAFNIDFGNGTTGIDTLDNLTICLSPLAATDGSPGDNLSDAWYDLSGRKIVKPSNGQMPKGVYINRGRKVVIK